MSATTIMLLAFGALILTHWANNAKQTLSLKALIEMVFAVIVIALLDQGKTAHIATGFAWLFLAAVLLRKDSILQALGKAANAKGNQPKPKPKTGGTIV